MTGQFSEFMVSNDALDDPYELRNRMDDLGYLFFALDSFLAGKEYTKGHLVLVSIFFYSQTLHYCLSREKLGIGWSQLIERCYKYFDKNTKRYLCWFYGFWGNW